MCNQKITKILSLYINQQPLLGNFSLMDLKSALNLKLYFERFKREPSPNFCKC